MQASIRLGNDCDANDLSEADSSPKKRATENTLFWLGSRVS